MSRIASTTVRRISRLAALAAAPVSLRRNGLQRVGSNYFVRSTIDANSAVIDCGLGYDADFSDAIISRYGCQCYGIDPTRKHQEALADVASRHCGRLHLYTVALAGSSGTATFHEPVDQVSGSLFDSHVNARNAVSYTVPSMTLPDLLAHLDLPRVDLLKLDIEGAEYELLANTDDEVLRSIGQIIVEFHHHCVGAFTLEDTRRVLARLAALGFRRYSVDAINYLFFLK